MNNTRFTRRSNGPGLALLLSLLVLVPSVCLLWFMNKAVENERLAVRQRLIVAYRAHLALAQERIESFWRQTLAEAELQSSKPEEFFERQIESRQVDSVTVLGTNGKAIYPDSVAPPESSTPDLEWIRAGQRELTEPLAAAASYSSIARQATNVDLAARALQAQARCFLKATNREAALEILLGPLAEPRFEQAHDAQGTLVAPNAVLLALELLHDAEPAANSATSSKTPAVLKGLQARLSDYGTPMPAPQRRFLMHQVQTLFPKEVPFPTLAAEDLSARFLESGPIVASRGVFSQTALPGVWQIASPQGRIVFLFKSDTLVKQMQNVAASPSLPQEASIRFLKPGQEADAALLTEPAGPALPGWRIGIAADDQRLFDSAGRQRVASYVWTSALVLASVAALALLMLRLVHRQMALTQLRNDLVANVTHELKTPLSSMRLLVETLLNSERLDQATAREYLQLIARENLRLSSLIDNFLAFSRIERNKYNFNFKTTPAVEILDAAADSVRERFSVPGCRFKTEAPANIPAVLADKDAMVTSLVNLLDNAYKYSGEDKQITLSASAQNGCVRFSVQDNGIGLPASETKRIFKRFYQVQQGEAHASGGCGLGLSIVKAIVDAHHGQITVESQPGKGSTFIISLPVSAKSGGSDRDEYAGHRSDPKANDLHSFE